MCSIKLHEDTRVAYNVLVRYCDDVVKFEIVCFWADAHMFALIKLDSYSTTQSRFDSANPKARCSDTGYSYEGLPRIGKTPTLGRNLSE